MSADQTHESVYDGLLGDQQDAHWAFGTGFDDPLATLDTRVPDGLDAAALAAYSLGLADDALLAGHRLSQWCGRAPELEEDVALANIALDLLGQARLLLARATGADPGLVRRLAPALPPGSPVPAEDALAFFRDAAAWRNVRLVEAEHGDFGETVARLLVLAIWRLALLTRLRASADPVLARIAASGAVEAAYHRDHAARWVVVLGRGTAESARRVQAGLTRVWPWVWELTAADPVQSALVGAGVAPDPAEVAAEVEAVLDEVVAAAGLERPGVPDAGRAGGTGRLGVHTEALSRLLAEMQSVARAHPRGRW